jgi:hypothetical protein
MGNKENKKDKKSKAVKKIFYEKPRVISEKAFSDAMLRCTDETSYGCFCPGGQL